MLLGELLRQFAHVGKFGVVILKQAWMHCGQPLATFPTEAISVAPQLTL